MSAMTWQVLLVIARPMAEMLVLVLAVQRSSLY
jgi:hypothetical protein